MRISRLLAVVFCLVLVGCAAFSKDMRLSDKGFEALSQGKFVEAEKYLNEALAVNPDNPYAVLNMGVVYQNTGRIDDAKKMYRKVIELNPKERADKSNQDGARGKPLVDIAKENLSML